MDGRKLSRGFRKFSGCPKEPQEAPRRSAGGSREAPRRPPGASGSHQETPRKEAQKRRKIWPRGRQESPNGPKGRSNVAPKANITKNLILMTFSKFFEWSALFTMTQKLTKNALRGKRRTEKKCVRRRGRSHGGHPRRLPKGPPPHSGPAVV